MIQKHKDSININLSRVNLLVKSIKCDKGDSGLISLNLIRGTEKVSYSRDGKIQLDFKMNLYYPLITKIHGYQPQEEKISHDFVPYLDTVKCTMTGEFQPPIESILEKAESIKEKPSLEFKFKARFSSQQYYIEEMIWEGIVTIFIAVTFERHLKIQPVFVRSDPGGPSTGKSFDVLIQSAKYMWRKCCIFLYVLEPIYVDDGAYLEINSDTEAQNLRDEVDIDDVIEVFFAEKMTQWFYDNWGGGATFDSGTASAKVVTCDEQLEVYNSAGTSLGTLNVNHLAHELGHVLSLKHPGVPAIAPMITATANTVMEPSGFEADNPHPQSQHNCDSADNPIIKFHLKLVESRCKQSPEL